MRSEETSVQQSGDLEPQAKDEAKEVPTALTDEEKEELRAVMQQSFVSFSGPLPPPDILKKYEEAMPGAADRILGMAEKEQSYRHDTGKKQASAASRDSLLGLVFAFFSVLFSIGLGTSIMIIHPSAGTFLSGSLLNLAGMGTLINAFRRRQDKNVKNEDKQQQ